ncbi:hypothetical protein F6X37_32630 [Paraburkholderia sp. 31.1]|uniref:hypothetical protein n=1 Tax=Paraburkholderia sp. 31.1 TaxID=2615205 RepID=UPI0016552338|nr:hypothetical protein [Paraburkholderia sp. 31.1]MBC8726108.1 hypothetical protein [Paraburkholderia sp. 31.1]
MSAETWMVTPARGIYKLTITVTGAYPYGYPSLPSWSEFDANRTSGRGSAIDAARRSANSRLSGNRCASARASFTHTDLMVDAVTASSLCGSTLP